MLVSSGAEAELAGLAEDFPTVALSLSPDHGTTRATIELGRWMDRTVDFAEFDAVIDDLVARGPASLVLRGKAEVVVTAAGEMLTRWQRHVRRRNRASETPVFDRVLDRLRAMHDLSKPLVVADWNHALDAWMWMLRLAPEASAAAQLSALLHDVERLESEATRRVEHLAPSYDHFKAEHARRGAAIALGVLEACGVDETTARRAADLVQNHERPGPDPEGRLLSDSDALSFFSQNSAGYLDYFGPAQTARKVAYTVRRMSRAALARLGTFRLRADVARLLGRVREGLSG